MGFSSFGLSLTTMEEVFMKVGTGSTQLTTSMYVCFMYAVSLVPRFFPGGGRGETAWEPLLTHAHGIKQYPKNS